MSLKATFHFLEWSTVFEIIIQLISTVQRCSLLYACTEQTTCTEMRTISVRSHNSCYDRRWHRTRANVSRSQSLRY